MGNYYTGAFKIYHLRIGANGTDKSALDLVCPLIKFRKDLESISACYAQNRPILPEFLTAHGNARYTIHAQRTAFFLSTRCSQALRDFRRRMESGAIVGIGAAAAPSKPAGSAAPTERASTSIVTGAATAAGGSSPVVNTARTRITTAGAGPGPGPGPAA